ncbi:MAG TPA: class I poly(R)-hydroxyalkanoic acid synthase [Burkholderiales bacterium]|nr:class I poly(R)-hydroxyalkanoic acid synthase [Burkholderiales bacterium]
MSQEDSDIARVCHDVAGRSSKLLGEFAQKQSESLSAAVRDEMGIAKAFMDLYVRVAADPALMASVSMNLWLDYARLWQASWMRLMGLQAPPVAEPAKGDARFKDDDWSSNFIFDHIKQSYLIAARHLQSAVANVEGLPPESEKKVAFFTRQYIDALAPSNFLLTNPQVLRETLQSGGQNLVRGLNNLLADLEKGGGQLRISMTDERAFELGKNVATTPGKVVFQTDLMQLIQYEPATPEVHRRPLVIIPPWINKYYILDLREKNSFIRWAVAQGHTVFVLSWVNPDARLAQKGFDDYMKEGALAALDAVAKATGELEANVIGYCLGGTLLGATLGYLANKGQAQRVASATYFVSLLDFSEPGELGVFIDEETVASLERKMNERGYLEGSEMAGTFNLLRANDLVWSFVVNNYLLGKDPFPFDLLYWNADSTRMPARMHSFYLRSMYIKNLLGVPGGIELDGVPVDLSAVKVPSYFISTVEDHIAPWKTTYKGAKYLGGPVRFVLGGSGHIAGIVNPPASGKYHYWVNDAFPDTPDAWFAGARQVPGSWWEDWRAWIERQNEGEPKVPSRVPGAGLSVLEDAPGSYAKMRIAARKSSGA